MTGAMRSRRWRAGSETRASGSLLTCLLTNCHYWRQRGNRSSVAFSKFGPSYLCVYVNGRVYSNTASPADVHSQFISGTDR